MHYGSIKNKGTLENDLWVYLANRPGQWISAVRLVNAINTICIATAAAGVRAQLPAGWKLENKLVKRDGRRKHSFYRLSPPEGEND